MSIYLSIYFYFIHKIKISLLLIFISLLYTHQTLTYALPCGFHLHSSQLKFLCTSWISFRALMEFHLVPILTSFLLVVVVVSHAYSLPSEVDGKSALPTTPFRKAVRNLLMQPGRSSTDAQKHASSIAEYEASMETLRKLEEVLSRLTMMLTQLPHMMQSTETLKN
ncbi:unnamed protein product, partial [Vitis vinifera]